MFPSKPAAEIVKRYEVYHSLTCPELTHFETAILGYSE